MYSDEIIHCLQTLGCDLKKKKSFLKVYVHRILKRTGTHPKQQVLDVFPGILWMSHCFSNLSEILCCRYSCLGPFMLVSKGSWLYPFRRAFFVKWWRNLWLICTCLDVARLSWRQGHTGFLVNIVFACCMSGVVENIVQKNPSCVGTDHHPGYLPKYWSRSRDHC